ncbi:hypothetical protein P8C59_004703 [Phyllachora maydis]|uniref:Uncharacterized protein n=1 Tax=Phyllachora maydis TaxID=1825666 RepID=A0AAD9MDS6_9PEZI|nr:hypothetical protein P8C59_004703 [Phyllachora maydis]
MQTAEDAVDDVPDPDEDDLDDLDDLLDEFSAVNPDSEKSEGGPRELQDLLGDIETTPEMQAQWESMFKELGAAAASSQAEGSDDFLAELLKQMQAGGLEGEGDEEDLSKMLMGMMDQLTHKEILYEPMKELNDKFPEWLQKNKDKTSKEDLRRYEEQLLHVKEIVARFEQTGYADSNAADREYIIDRMQKMQAAGSPPADLVGDMPSAQEALNMPECNTQ